MKTKTMCALVKTPFIYEPLFKDGVYVDDIKDIKYSVFQEIGVKCSCSATKTIHKNKNSFTYQHCNSKKHLEYIKKLNNNINLDDIQNPKLYESLRKEIKQMKIQILKEHEELQLQRQYNLQLQNQIKNTIQEKSEAIAHAEQSDLYIQEITRKLHKIEETNKELETKNKKYEKNIKEMMIISGYEIQ